MKPVLVNLTTVLASAMYWQLSIPMNAALSANIKEFNVGLTTTEKLNGYCTEGICGYVKTNNKDKEIKLDFSIAYRNNDDIIITVTQNIIDGQDDLFTSRSNERDDVFTPIPNEQVYVNFQNRKVFYKREYKLSINIDPEYSVILDDDNNELTLDSVAQNIINTILAKI